MNGFKKLLSSIFKIYFSYQFKFDKLTYFNKSEKVVISK
jgi:hypothetical protein